MSIEKNLTQEYLAEQIGISSRTLSRIENNKRFVKFEELIVISKVIGLNPSELFGNVEQYNFNNYNVSNKIFKKDNGLAKNNLYQKLITEKETVIELLKIANENTI